MGNLSEEKDQMNKSERDMWNKLKEPAPIIDAFGIQRWFNKAGELHRENDLPAIIFENGSKFWYKNGERHRENDLPAIIWNYGRKVWYKNGEFIRREHLK